MATNTYDVRLKTTNSQVAIVNLKDVLTAITEMQEDLVVVQDAINSIDTSASSSLGKQFTVLTTNLNNLVINMNNVTARVTVLEDTIHNINVVQPVIEPPKPSFFAIVLGKFTNTWK